jgi:hypothetical protein
MIVADGKFERMRVEFASAGAALSWLPCIAIKHQSLLIADTCHPLQQHYRQSKNNCNMVLTKK